MQDVHLRVEQVMPHSISSMQQRVHHLHIPPSPQTNLSCHQTMNNGGHNHHYHHHKQQQQQQQLKPHQPNHQHNILKLQPKQLQIQQQQQHPHNDLHVPRSPSSEEDNSPTEMNNCRRLIDKPPLVKRLTMGMGLMRTTEDSRPLVHTKSSSMNSTSSQAISDGYVNEAICEPDKLITNKFGESCRQSLNALSTLVVTQRLQEQSEFSYKKKYQQDTWSDNSSPKMIARSAPLRLDNVSLAEQNELKAAAWFQAGIPREISLEVLSRQSPGAFLVRQSSTKPGCFALSLRVPTSLKVAHYLIMKTPRGFKIKGFTKEFPSLRALITHHSVMPELLPVPLTLPRPTISSGGSSTFCDGDFETYGSLNDFRKMMSDLNV